MSIVPAVSYSRFENDGFYEKRHLFFGTPCISFFPDWTLLDTQVIVRREGGIIYYYIVTIMLRVVTIIINLVTDG